MAGRRGELMGSVEIRSVSRVFTRDDDVEVRALEDVSLSIREDEFISLVGPSGCGKTTLLRIIAGLDHADRGEILVDRTAITGPDPKVGMVFQEYSLFPWRNVLDNVAFGIEMRGVKHEERHAVARQFIDLVGLSQFEKSYPYELSGGMKQRVAIARALANDPDILLMDEPFGALDAQTRNKMQAELLKTIVFVTHSVDEAVFLSDRIVVLSSRPGRIRTVVPVTIPRPRERTAPEFAALRREVLCLIDEEECQRNP